MYHKRTQRGVWNKKSFHMRMCCNGACINAPKRLNNG
jgi:hypothetical protein